MSRYVYFAEIDLSNENMRKLQRENDGYYSDIIIKIGKATNVMNRISSLQSGCPIPYTRVRYMEGDGYLEESFHKVFKTRRVRGEWFRSDPYFENILNSYGLKEIKPKNNNKPYVDKYERKEREILGIFKALTSGGVYLSKANKLYIDTFGEIIKHGDNYIRVERCGWNSEVLRISINTASKIVDLFESLNSLYNMTENKRRNIEMINAEINKNRYNYEQ